MELNNLLVSLLLHIIHAGEKTPAGHTVIA